MKTLKTVLLITGILVVGLAFNTVAQSTPSLDANETPVDKTLAHHEGKAVKKENKREWKAVAKGSKHEYKKGKHDNKDHKHGFKAANR